MGTPPEAAPEHWVDPFAREHAPPIEKGWLKTAAAITEVIFAGPGGPPPDERLRWLAAQLEDFFAQASFQARAVFRISLWAVCTVGPLLVLRPRRLRSLPLARRATALDRIERSPAGPALFAVKAILGILYFEHPDVAREVGFDGAPLGGRS